MGTTLAHLDLPALFMENFTPSTAETQVPLPQRLAASENFRDEIRASLDGYRVGRSIADLASVSKPIDVSCLNFQKAVKILVDDGFITRRPKITADGEELDRYFSNS